MDLICVSHCSKPFIYILYYWFLKSYEAGIIIIILTLQMGKLWQELVEELPQINPSI